MPNVQQQGIIVLVKSALSGKAYALPEGFDLSAAAKTAKKHQIVNALFYGAVNCGIPQQDPVMSNLFLLCCRLISVSENQLLEIKKLYQVFDENNIDYMPLKGTLLKALYPQPDMRTMSDADILIKTHQYKAIKPLLLQLGYCEEAESDHELIWNKSGLHLELHKRLIPSYNKDYYSYYGDGWKLAKQKAVGTNRYIMRDEDELIYLFTHFSKHYRDGGIGIKHMTDLWLFRRQKSSLDNAYIQKELTKLQLYTFYQNICETLAVWFEDKTPNEKTDFITDVIFNSGAYGTHASRITSAVVKGIHAAGSADAARKRNLVRILFPPVARLAPKYTLLKKVPALLPFVWIVRWIETPIFGFKRILQKKKDVDFLTNDRIEAYQQSLQYVGLDFNFKESFL